MLYKLRRKCKKPCLSGLSVRHTSKALVSLMKTERHNQKKFLAILNMSVITTRHTGKTS